MTESADFLKIYQKFRNYFIDELGYKPFRKDPDSLQLNNSKNPEKKKKNSNFLSDFQSGAIWTEIDHHISLIINEENSLIEEMIARECLLSFLPTEIRNYPLMYFYIYRRLIFGKKPLSVKSKNRLKKFYSKIEKSLIDELLKDEFAYIDYLVIDKRLPKNKIEEYSKRYFYSFSNLRQLLSKTENNSEIIYSIEEDYLYSFIFDRIYSEGEIILLKYLIKGFYITKNPVSPLDFKNLVTQNQNLPQEKKENSLVFFENKKNFAKINDLYQSLGKRLVSFNFRVNYELLGIEQILFFVRISENSNIKVLDYCLKNLDGILYIQDNISQKETIKMGIIVTARNNLDIVKQFFINLKNFNLIEEFSLQEQISLKTVVNFRFFNLFQKGSDDSIEFEINYKKYRDREVNKLDCIDTILLRLLSFTGSGFGLKTGVKIIEVFLNELRKELNKIASQLENTKTILQTIKSSEINNSIIFHLLPNWNLDNEFNQENINLIEFIENIIRQKGFFLVKYYFESILAAYNLLDNINFKDYKNDATILTNSNFNNLANISLLFFNEINIKNWLLDIINLAKNNKKTTAKIINYVKLILKFLEIYRFFMNGDQKSYIQNLTSNYKIIKGYILKDTKEIEKNIRNRIKNYKNFEIIKPSLINSIFLPMLYSKRTLILENIESNSPKIKKFINLVPFIDIYKRSILDLKKTNLVVYFYLQPHLNKSISAVIQTLFKDEIVFYGNFFGEIYLYYFNLSEFDMNSAENKIQKENFLNMMNFIRLHKKGPNSVNPESPFYLFNHSKTNNRSKTDNKSINTLLRQVDTIFSQNSNETKVNLQFLKNRQNIVQEILNLEKIFKDIPEKFDSMQNSFNFISQMIPIPNYEKFDLNKYIVQIKIKKNEFDTKEYGIINTGEFLLCPGFEKIERSSQLGYFETHFIHYVFPRDDPCENILKYVYSRKIISFYRFMKIKRKYVSFAPTFHLSFDDWNSTYRTWEIFVSKLLFNDNVQYTPRYKVYNLNNHNDIIFSRNSEEFAELVKIYGKNIKTQLNLMSNKLILNLIDLKCIKLFPVINFLEIGLVNKLYIFLANTNQMQEEMILKIFSTVPFSEVNEIEYFESELVIKINKNIPNGLFINLYLPNSRIEQFYSIFLGICKYLEIKEFQVMPDIIDMDISDFSSGKIRKKVNPLKSHIWNKKSKKWSRIRYFDEKGIPLPHRERVKYLKLL